MTTTIGHHAEQAMPDRATPRPAPRRRSTRLWPLFGVAGGVTALAATLVDTRLDPSGIGSLVLLEGDGLDLVDHRLFLLLSVVSVGCLLVASTGWKRWADQRAGDSLAARTIPTALATTAAGNLLAASLAASALHGHGTVDAGSSVTDGSGSARLLNLALVPGWWATVVAALCLATLAVDRERLVPRWMAVVSLASVVPPVLLVGFGRGAGLPALTMPIWLIVISVGMVRSGVANRRPTLVR